MTLVKSNNKGRTPALRSSLFNDPFFSDLMTPRWGMLNRFFNEPEEVMEMTPAMNIKEREKDVQIELAAPGLNKDDFQITLDNGILTISAEKESKQEEEKEGFYRKEFSYNSFTRSVRIPETVDEEKEIEAKYSDGLLKLTLQKKPDLQHKKQKSIKVS